MLGPDPNQVTSVLLFAASTSRQLRAVSEGPRRKGKGAKDYYTWLEAKYSKAFYVGESRASGGRQDLEFEASVAAYVDRPHYVKFLEAMLADPQHRNILETSARPRRAFRGKKRVQALLVPQLRSIRTDPDEPTVVFEFLRGLLGMGAASELGSTTAKSRVFSVAP